ncbi:TcdA/TcdB catalytic glycosyltransferase domain-containing protein [Streptomyces zhihengii]
MSRTSFAAPDTGYAQGQVVHSATTPMESGGVPTMPRTAQAAPQEVPTPSRSYDAEISPIASAPHQASTALGQAHAPTPRSDGQTESIGDQVALRLSGLIHAQGTFTSNVAKQLTDDAFGQPKPLSLVSADASAMVPAVVSGQVPSSKSGSSAASHFSRVDGTAFDTNSLAGEWFGVRQPSAMMVDRARRLVAAVIRHQTEQRAERAADGRPQEIAGLSAGIADLATTMLGVRNAERVARDMPAVLPAVLVRMVGALEQALTTQRSIGSGESHPPLVDGAMAYLAAQSLSEAQRERIVHQAENLIRSQHNLHDPSVLRGTRRHTLREGVTALVAAEYHRNGAGAALELSRLLAQAHTTQRNRLRGGGKHAVDDARRPSPISTGLGVTGSWTTDGDRHLDPHTAVEDGMAERHRALRKLTTVSAPEAATGSGRFDQLGPATPAPAGSNDKGPLLQSTRTRRLEVKVSFEENSKEIGGTEKAKLDELAKIVVLQAYRNARAGLPLPRISITGYGNGAKFSTLSRSQRAQNTGLKRATSASTALRESVARSLDDLRGTYDPQLSVSDLAVYLNSAGRQSPSSDSESSDSNPSEMASARRTAIVEVSYHHQPVVLGNEGASSTAGVRPVARVMHFIWLGGEMREGAKLNLEAWKRRIQDSGWQMNIWSDAGAMAANSSFYQELQDAPEIQIRSVDEEFFESLRQDNTLELDPTVASRPSKLFRYAMEKEAWELASDVTRYALLYLVGGVYLDVDLTPGSVQLPASGINMRHSAIPFLAPQIRNRSQFDAIAREMNFTKPLDGGADARKPELSEEESLAKVAEWQLSRGRFNNNLIVAPAGSPFLRQVLANLSDPHDPAQAMRFAAPRQNAADISGPFLLGREILRSVTETGPLSPTLKWRDAFSSGLITVHPSQHRWNGLGWLTEESENLGRDKPLLTSLDLS